MLVKSNMPDKEKEKWLKGFTAEMMSSEESEDDDDVITVKPLPWRSERLTTMFYRLDNRVESGKTTQAKRQKRKRVLGVIASTRPQADDVPQWALK